MDQSTASKSLRLTAEQLTRAADDLQPDSGQKPMHQFAMAVGLYLLWCSLAWLSDLLGQSSLDREEAIILLAGISATNALFFGIARANRLLAPPASAVATAQCLLGISWATVYTFFSQGGGELVLGMYVTTVLFAIFQVDNQTFTRLTLFAAISYGGVIAASLAIGEPKEISWSDSLQVLVFLGIMAWVLLYARHIHSLRRQLHERNDKLHSMMQKMARAAERDHLTKSFNRHYIMDTLTREKGRADRSNNPFCICIFDLDHFKAINDDHGHLVGDRILKGFAKRVRNELRAMDALNPTDFKRSFGRFGGEEFITILPCTGLHGAERCAERIREAIA
ncbi:MAG: GGDEF domain-containing protein, partial [Gammaproteobacteria bacterium]|nr:GGDEF domain-containing protein [Gammaproteobacteria bacterium]